MLLKCLLVLLPMLSLMTGCGEQQKPVTTHAANYAKDVRKGIKKNIDDKDRREQLLALHDETERLNSEIAFLYLEAGNQIRSDPNLTQSEIDDVMNDCSDKRKTILNNIGKIRMQMRALTSKAEWDAVFGTDAPAKSPPN